MRVVLVASKRDRFIDLSRWEYTMTLRLDLSQRVDEIEAALRRAAEAAWGADALPEVEPALETSARALWRISQEPLEPADAEP